jgi:hypothetical protein
MLTHTKLITGMLAALLFVSTAAVAAVELEL